MIEFDATSEFDEEKCNEWLEEEMCDLYIESFVHAVVDGEWVSTEHLHAVQTSMNNVGQASQGFLNHHLKHLPRDQQEEVRMIVQSRVD